MTASQSASLLRANRPAVNGWSADYLDDQYKLYLQNPTSVPADMQQFFAGFDLANGAPRTGPVDDTQRKADALVRGYRDLGHLAADIDPFHRPR
ncbi:MAG: 2-oxoglutarate dehydrogenase E1 subunit family protein, partial [Phycisphaerae bacterium]